MVFIENNKKTIYKNINYDFCLEYYGSLNVFL